MTLEASDEVAVFDLREALSARSRSALVGLVPLGRAPVGPALSPDGRWLYVTSESSRNGGPHSEGSLWVLSVARAETSPRRAVVASVSAGCSPVRVMVSPDAKTVWVTARGSDALLGYSAAGLVTNPKHARVVDVMVGKAPVGLALVDRVRRAVVADSDRFGPEDPPSNLAVVNVEAALAGRPALLGYVPASRFPREASTTPDGGSVLVTNFASGEIEIVPVRDLP